MKFCTHCGNAVILQIPPGDDRERFVCSSCELIHYSNPRVIVGCVPVYEGRVLLCKRAIEPRKNYWTLPAGFMENGETSVQGAARETWEEARAKVSNIDLYRVFDVPYISQIYMFYRCNLDGGEHAGRTMDRGGDSDPGAPDRETANSLRSPDVLCTSSSRCRPRDVPSAGT